MNPILSLPFCVICSSYLSFLGTFHQTLSSLLKSFLCPKLYAVFQMQPHQVPGRGKQSLWFISCGCGYFSQRGTTDSCSTFYSPELLGPSDRAVQVSSLCQCMGFFHSRFQAGLCICPFCTSSAFSCIIPPIYRGHSERYLPATLKALLKSR